MFWKFCTNFRNFYLFNISCVQLLLLEMKIPWIIYLCDFRRVEVNDVQSWYGLGVTKSTFSWMVKSTIIMWSETKPQYWIQNYLFRRRLQYGADLILLILWLVRSILPQTPICLEILLSHETKRMSQFKHLYVR